MDGVFSDAFVSKSSTEDRNQSGWERDLAAEGYALLRMVGGLDAARSIVARLGRLCPQYDGELLYDVKSRGSFEKFAYTGSQNAIGPHTEAPLWERPPRYLALYGVRSASEGGETLLYDMKSVLDVLDAESTALLRSTHVQFARRNCGQDEYCAARPLLEDVPGRCLRFSHNLFMRGDIDGRLDATDGSVLASLPPAVRAFVRANCAAFEREAIAIGIPADALLVWDNHRMLHGRASYRDPGRHLVRMWIDDGGAA